MTATPEIPELLASALRRGDGDACPTLERLAATAADEAEPADRVAVLAHATECAACDAELEVASRLGLAPLSERRLEPDQAAVERIAARLAAGDLVRRPAAPRLSLAPTAAPATKTAVRPAPPSDRASRASWLVAAAGLVLAVGAATVWWLGPARPPALPEPSSTAVARGTTLRLESPLGEVDQLPQAFVWERVPAASEYELRLFAVDGRELGHLTVPAPVDGEHVAFALDGTAIASIPLEAAVRYEWQVVALDAEGGTHALSLRASFRAKPEPSR
ncbi:MAG TPA: hypothetical protein VNB06_19155 [Thermoanaerobaculia bacterium]|nr:hypothetical protein [Thermoanaerobaculia bacterium]